MDSSNGPCKRRCARWRPSEFRNLLEGISELNKDWLAPIRSQDCSHPKRCKSKKLLFLLFHEPAEYTAQILGLIGAQWSHQI
jgi:hypothetical protein